MMFPVRWHFATVFTALVCAVAAGQTTQPAESSWPDWVGQLAQSLRDEPTQSILGQLVSEDTVINAFGSTQTESRYRLQQQTEGLLLVSARGYTWPAETIAADLAEDVEACDALPSAIRAQFVPRDEADAMRSNQTAQQWMASTLQPQTGQCVGVIMLWQPKAMVTSLLLGSDAGEANSPLLLLVKGQRVSENAFRITRIAYGDVRQALD